MQNKMKRFLLSIGIEEPESYDMDFVLVGRSPDQPGRVDMAIIKDSPWSYSQVEEFSLALGNIKYPYSIRFSYHQEPTFEDASNLLSMWYLGHYNDLPPFEVASMNPGVIEFVYDSNPYVWPEPTAKRILHRCFRFLITPSSSILRAESLPKPKRKKNRSSWKIPLSANFLAKKRGILFLKNP